MSEVSCYRPVPGTMANQIDFVERKIKSLCATVLTIIESSYNDPVQRDAVKLLVKKEFNRTLDSCRTL